MTINGVQGSGHINACPGGGGGGGGGGVSSVGVYG